MKRSWPVPSPPGCAATVTPWKSPRTGRVRWQVVAHTRPDAVVLDLMLPGFDGLEVCRRIQRDRPVPVIMLTARGSETDLVVGLEVGADDYLSKPFSMRELTARVRALLRRADRSVPESGQVLRAGGIEVDVSRRRAWRGGELVGLTATEFDLLVYLLAAPGVVRTRAELLAEVWGYRDGSGPAHGRLARAGGARQVRRGRDQDRARRGVCRH